MSRKSIIKRNLLVLPDARPTHEELEKFRKIRSRYLTAIKIRWYISFGIAFFLAIITLYFFLAEGFSVTVTNLWPYYLLTASFIVLNIIFQVYSNKLTTYKGFIQIQILLDVILVSLLLNASGGSISFFWVVYPLLILEAAFLFEEKVITWLFSILCSFIFIILSINNLFSPTSNQFPFAVIAPGQPMVYVFIVSVWASTINIIAAFIGNYLIGNIKKREKLLSQRVITDGLTGLFNQSYFNQSIKTQVNRSLRFKRPFSLILIDIDDFKLFNDRYGHREGDKLLLSLAEILSENIRSKGVDLVFRYGGEEFAIIAPETETKRKRPIGAVALAERLRNKIEKSLPITVSIGVGNFPSQGTNPEELFINTDKALFGAKAKNKNKVVIASSLQKKKRVA